MSVISNFVDQPFDFILGENPQLRWGTSAPDGDAEPFKSLPVGSMYMYAQSATIRKWYTKRANGQRDDDWAMGMHCVQQRVAYSDFTDGGSTSGTLALTETIPVGAWVQRVILQNVTGFTGDTTAVITVGDGSDVDRYNAGTPSVYTTANAIDLGAPSGTQIHTAAATVTLTITGTADFTSISAGNATVRIYYLL